MKEQNNGKSTWGSALATAILAAVCIAGGWIGRGLMPQRQPQTPAMQMPPATVAVRQAEMRPYNLPQRHVAHAEAVQEVDLLPQVDGYVKEIKFREGDMVEAGQLLYVLDGERYSAVVNQRKADLAAAEAEARRAQRYFERMRKADERGITQLERDNAEADAESAAAKVMQAKANLVAAEYDLKKTLVHAPISGQIGKTSAHVGDYVAPGKAPLAHIMQVDPIRVVFPLTDRSFVAWREARTAKGGDGFRTRLLLPDGSEYPGEGKFDFDDNQMSRETATILVRMSFANPGGVLVPNTYLTLLADRRDPPPQPCVPQQAVVDLPGGNQGVWVLREDGTVEQRVVQVKEAHRGWTPVAKGVQAGEKVVVSGVSKLRPGMKVAVVEATDNDDLNPEYRDPIAD